MAKATQDVRSGRTSAAPLQHPSRPPCAALGLDPAHWTGQVKGIGSAYRRIVGSAEAIAEKTKAIGQEWMKGIGYARWLAKTR